MRADEAAFTPEDLEFFEAKVRPLLAQHCYKCHSAKAEEIQSGLRLDGRELAIRGGDNGAAIVPGKPDESLLLAAVRWESLEMPPKNKLSAEQVTILRKWIESGAPWPKEEPSPVDVPQQQQAYDWAKLRAGHWAYRRLSKPAPPPVRDEAWVQNDIDRFILARLEAAGLQPSPPAEPRILVRRIYYDLIGLPPTPEQIADFESRIADWKKQNPKQSAIRIPHIAVTELIDELLASPQYGERWGRYWLDVARYSDGYGGFLDNAALPHAWKYRDWVVAALNRDLPFDQFVKLQIAGDLMDQGEEGRTATGFFALGPTYKSDGGDPDSVAQAKSETLDDRIDTLSRGFLGLTVSCARCHDHKFDPIPTLDYYSLAGVFNDTGNADPKTGLHALHDTGSGDMHVALRGNLRKPGEVAPRRFLQIIAGEDPPRFTKGSGRLELAAAVAAADNPLTARVFVNRVWMHHFGRALVRSPSNFGALGETPTHPQLLDWLAADFIASGWSLNQLHRTIMTSAAYQMSCRYDAASFQTDGDNRLLWRMNPRRLSAEAWRDTLLALTGELDPQLGGPPTDDVRSRRRTLYFKVSRNGDQFRSDEFLRLFDFPLMRVTVAKRPTSIVPQQFLFLMNSPFMSDRARALAARLEASAEDDATRIENAYRLLFGRQPSAAERNLGLAFLTQKSLSEETAPADAPKPDNEDLLIADFEGETYGDWKTTGEAFGPGPARGTLASQMAVSGFQGRGLVNSYFHGDGSTGTLTSPQLDIERRHIHFLVGGGKYPGQTCINLLVGGKVVRTATGPNDRGGGSERLAWTSWDVSEFHKQQAVIQIVDQRTGGWGHINVDHIFQSDQPLDASRLPANSESAASSGGLTPWQQYAQVLLSSNELMYLR